MNYIGKIIQLFASHKDKESRLSKEVLTLDTQGIQEDKFYAKDINRSVLITSVQSYSLALKHNIPMPYGILGENLLLDYNPYRLPIKTKLLIGQDIIIEISQPCTMCDHLSTIDNQLPILLKKDRGIFAKVLQGGIVQKGDKVYLLNT